MTTARTDSPPNAIRATGSKEPQSTDRAGTSAPVMTTSPARWSPSHRPAGTASAPATKAVVAATAWPVMKTVCSMTAPRVGGTTHRPSTLHSGMSRAPARQQPGKDVEPVQDRPFVPEPELQGGPPRGRRLPCVLEQLPRAAVPVGPLLVDGPPLGDDRAQPLLRQVLREGDREQQRDADLVLPRRRMEPLAEGGPPRRGDPVRLPFPRTARPGLDESALGHGGELAVHLALGEGPELTDALLRSLDEVPPGH